MHQLLVLTVLRWLALGWAAIVTLMLVAAMIATFIISGSFGEGLMRLTEIYGGLARSGYDEEAGGGVVLGNGLVILILYAPAFLFYAAHENLRRKSSADRK